MKNKSILLVLCIFLFALNVIAFDIYKGKIENDFSLDSALNGSVENVLENNLVEEVSEENNLNSSDEGEIISRRSSSSGSISSEGGSSTSSDKSENTLLIDIQKCLDNYGLEPNVVIFYYTDDVNSNPMIPIVEELEEFYKFYKIDNLWGEDSEKCFDLTGETPSFVCAGTKERIAGKMDKSILEEFVIKCNDAF